MADLPYGNRLGRALCELIEHLPSDGHPQHGVANATIVVTVDETRLRAGAGEAVLDTGGAISVGETRRLACNAGLLPMVLSGGSKILDLGISRVCSTATNASPWLPEIKAASFLGVNADPPGPRHITASRGVRAARPTSTTAASSAASTTTSSTKANGTSPSRRTASPKSSHPPASTRNEDPSATNASNPDPASPNERHRSPVL